MFFFKPHSLFINLIYIEKSDFSGCKTNFDSLTLAVNEWLLLAVLI